MKPYKTVDLGIVNDSHKNTHRVVLLIIDEIGASLIDFVLVDEHTYHVIQIFKPGTFCQFSDHCPIMFTLKAVYT